MLDMVDVHFHVDQDLFATCLWTGLWLTKAAVGDSVILSLIIAAEV